VFRRGCDVFVVISMLGEEQPSLPTAVAKISVLIDGAARSRSAAGGRDG
jgi:hypothetical protein